MRCDFPAPWSMSAVCPSAGSRLTGVARALTRQAAPCGTLALRKLSDTRSRAWVLCFKLCERVCASALERGPAPEQPGSLVGVGARLGWTARVKQMAEELLHASDLGVIWGCLPRQAASVSVWWPWRGSACVGAQLLVCSPGREPGGGWEQVVLGFLLALGSASSVSGAVLEGIWGHLPSP